MLVSIVEPTARQRRILGNLKSGNLIWEVVGRKYFSQFDDRSDRELHIRAEDLREMIDTGWIRLVQLPRSEQRLNRYELAGAAPGFEEIGRRKPPLRESEGVVPMRLRRRG